MDLGPPLCLDIDHQRWQIDGEGSGEPVDVDHPDIPATPLNVTDVARMEARLLGEPLLREPAR